MDVGPDRSTSVACGLHAEARVGGGASHEPGEPGPWPAAWKFSD